ncbi:MAG TPA: hypothetical protein VES89_03580, partial [Candidatus Competibacteraceae bacterium]|nr:hypothetical protein [Candidatus Competibacteraceae bacterium]
QRRVEQGLSGAADGRESGLSRTAAAHRRRLLRLTPAVQAQVAQGTLPPGKARALVGLPAWQQLELADRIARERLTTRQVEALAKAWKADRAVITSPTPLANAMANDPNVTQLEKGVTSRALWLENKEVTQAIKRLI